MSVSGFIHKKLVDLLEDHRVVVWYDPNGDFEDFIKNYSVPNGMVVNAKDSMLTARRDADLAIAGMNNPAIKTLRNINLLIYCPWSRHQGQDEEGCWDPFECYARMGTAFGDKEAETLQSLARQALQEVVSETEINRLFQEGKPTVELLDKLKPGQSYPLVKEALGTESAIEATAKLLCIKTSPKRLSETKGAIQELRGLLEKELGYKAPPQTRSVESVFGVLGQYVLLSEFAFDLPGAFPSALETLTVAEEKFREKIFPLCDRMRDSDIMKEGYIELATKLEEDLRLREVAKDIEELGVRDTFPFEEKAYLHHLQEYAEAGKLDKIFEVLSQRKNSIWRNLPNRDLLWRLAGRCLDFLQAVNDWSEVTPSKEQSVKVHIEAYVEKEKGFWRVDRFQRQIEQHAAQCLEDSEVESMLSLVRKHYNDVVSKMQKEFAKAVEREGWPPEGIVRQTQTFDSNVSKSLQEGKKVAYFMVDALRYEMGHDLYSSLWEKGATAIKAAVTVLPTSTSCGMAALMPGADGTWGLKEKKGELVPVVSTKELPGSKERMAFFAERYGDRMCEMTLNKFLSSKEKKLSKQLEKVDLLIVRTQDIDLMGETLHQARRYMSDVLQDLIVATNRVLSLGFNRMVYASDHGHVLVPEVLPGNVLSDPPGEWKLRKRRCRLGKSHGESPGIFVMDCSKVGINAPVPDFAVVSGLKVFSAGEGYFHEGLSPQECLIPVITLDTRGPEQVGTMKEEIEIAYKAKSISNQIFTVTVSYMSLLVPEIQIRIFAYDGATAKANQVGEAADCDARNSANGIITLKSGDKTSVPISLYSNPESETIEVRALDTGPGVILARLKLKNNIIW